MFYKGQIKILLKHIPYFISSLPGSVPYSSLQFISLYSLEANTVTKCLAFPLIFQKCLGPIPSVLIKHTMCNALGREVIINHKFHVITVLIVCARRISLLGVMWSTEIWHFNWTEIWGNWTDWTDSFQFIQLIITCNELGKKLVTFCISGHNCNIQRTYYTWSTHYVSLKSIQDFPIFFLGGRETRGDGVILLSRRPKAGRNNTRANELTS